MSLRLVRRSLVGGIAAMALTALVPASWAKEPLEVVATFSILGDLAQEIGGERINLVTLVGPNEDAHVLSPEPSHARALAQADLVLVNGLGFEGWIDRLILASGYDGPVVVASDGVVPLSSSDAHADEDHDDENHAAGDDHDDHNDAHDHDAHDHGDVDPHAWQDVANARIYIDNIETALIEADPAGRELYQANATRYLAELNALEAEIQTALDAVPLSRRTVVTSHEAFGYLGHAYGITFLAPAGVSTDGEPSASDMAVLIRQIRDEGVTAVFLENAADNRLVEQIVAETDARVGGTLYSDALSGADGPASSYLDMMRHNALSLTGTMQAF